MTKAITEFFSGALTTLDICADHAWPSVAGSDTFKMALIDVNRKAKSVHYLYYTEYSSIRIYFSF